MPMSAVSVVMLMALVAGQDGPDFLGKGVVFIGPVTFERGVADTPFTIRTPSSEVIVAKVNTARGFPVAPNESVSAEWARALSRTDRAAIRIAAMSDALSIGDELNEALLKQIVQCLAPKPAQRTAHDVTYTLDCVAYEEERRWLTETGKMRWELGFTVTVPRQSAAAQSLMALSEQKVVYVRLETAK